MGAGKGLEPLTPRGYPGMLPLHDPAMFFNFYYTTKRWGIV